MCAGPRYARPLLAVLYFMSAEYKDLIKWADTVYTERDADFIEKWLAANKNKCEAVNDLALFLAKGYINDAISFDIASTLFNQVMPVIGFDEAPELFWSFYTAFEDYELQKEPGADAKNRIKRELLALNEI